MRMVKTDNALAPATRQLQGCDHLFGIDAVAVRRRICPYVLASAGHDDHAVPLPYVTKKNSPALIRIAALGFPSNQVVVSLAYLQHFLHLLGSGGFTSHPARK